MKTFHCCLLKRVQAGIARLRMLKGTAPRVQLPITPHVLSRIHKFLSSSSDQDKTVILAVATTAFFRFFQRGELLPTSAAAFNATTDLAWGDVVVDNRRNPRMLQIHLITSKTQQFGPGVDVVLGTAGATLCPVTVMVQYIAERGSQPGASPTKTALTKAQFVSRIRAILQLLGLPHCDYAGHSFRIGAATTAASMGVEDSMIQTLGRWHSAAFLQYIRTPKEQLAAMSAVLATSSPRQT